jgi:hypothetical protein
LGYLTVKATKESFLGKNKKTKKKRKKRTTFFNSKTETDPHRKPTFEQKTDPDPDRLPKVNPAGLYNTASQNAHVIQVSI